MTRKLTPDGARDYLKEGDDAARAVQQDGHPRVSLADIEAKIVTIEYIKSNYLPTLTICVCHTQNGFAVVGKSAPADPSNYDEELGKRFAKEDCIRQLWQLEGYLLREKLGVGRSQAHTRS